MEKFLQFVATLLPIASFPGLLLLMYYMPYFKLDPLARWQLDTESWRFVPCLVGAFVGYFYPKGNASHKIKVITVGVFGAVSTLFPYLYQWLSSIPPTEGSVEYISKACYVVFLATYFALGLYVFNVRTRYYFASGFHIQHPFLAP